MNDTENTGALNAAVDDTEDASGPLSAFDTSRIQSKLAEYQKVGSEQKAYYDRLRDEILARRMGPSASERLYQLGAALMAPTSVRGFSGTMNNVLPVLQEQAKATREGEFNRQKALEALTAQQLADRKGLLGQELTTEVALAKIEQAANKPVRGVAVGDRLVNPYTNEDIDIPIGTKKVYDGRVYTYTGGGQYDKQNWKAGK